MTFNRKFIIAAALCGLAAGCSPNDTGLGSAAKHNYAAQVVDPDPKHEGTLAANGDQTAAAQDRYRKGSVKKPKAIRTTSGSGGGSGGSSGGN